MQIDEIFLLVSRGPKSFNFWKYEYRSGSMANGVFQALLTLQKWREFPFPATSRGQISVLNAEVLSPLIIQKTLVFLDHRQLISVTDLSQLVYELSVSSSLVDEEAN